MKARLFIDGESAGHVDGVHRDTSVIIYLNEFYVFEASVNGYIRAKAQRVSRIEWTPKEINDPEPQLPMEL